MSSEISYRQPLLFRVALTRNSYTTVVVAAAVVVVPDVPKQSISTNSNHINRLAIKNML